MACWQEKRKNVVFSLKINKNDFASNHSFNVYMMKARVLLTEFEDLLYFHFQELIASWAQNK